MRAFSSFLLHPFALVLAASFALRVALFPVPGYATDLNTFAAWHATAAQDLPGFYRNVWSDYPPLNIYFFAAIGAVEGAAGLAGRIAAPFDFTEAVFLKLPQNLADLGVAVLLFVWLRPRGPRTALAGASVYAFNPAALFNPAVWGQWDALYTLFMVGSLVALLSGKTFRFARFFGNAELSALLLALAILTKPQGVLALPVVAYVILREGGRTGRGWSPATALRRALSPAAVFGAAVLAVVAPFRGALAHPAGFIAERYFEAYDVYRETSLNAYNLWALAGMRVPEEQVSLLGLSPQVWGGAAFLSVAALLMWVLHRRYGAGDRDALLLQTAFLLVFAFFMLSTRIHERYLFPAIALLVMTWPANRLLLAAVSGSYLFNVAYVLHLLNNDIFAVRDATVPAMVALNAGLLVWALLRFWRMGK